MVKKIIKEREIIDPRKDEPQYPIGYEPTRAIRDIDRIFDSFKKDIDRLLWDPWTIPNTVFKHPIAAKVYAPRMNIQDKGDSYFITAELPGMNKENLNIIVEDNVITIKAKSTTEREEKDENYLLKERGAYSFERCFELAEDIKTEAVHGEMKDGVLHLTIPKMEPTQKKVHKVTLK